MVIVKLPLHMVNSRHFHQSFFGLTSLYNNAIRYLDNELLGGITKDIDLDNLKKKSLTLNNIQELFNLRSIIAKTIKIKKGH